MNKLFEIMPLFYYDAASVIVFFTLLIKFRTSSEKVKIRILYFMCSTNFVFYLINDYYFYVRGSKILTLLPLQLCNIAVFLIPVAIVSKRHLLMDFVFYICAPGALAALLTPSSDYIGITYSLMTISFFIFHCIIVLIPFLMAGWGIYKPRPTIRKALNLSAMILLLAGAMHLINLALGSLFKVEADYFFTIIKYSAPTNPVFALLSKIIPYNFFYLLPALLVLYVYMGIVFMITSRRTKYVKSSENVSRVI